MLKAVLAPFLAFSTILCATLFQLRDSSESTMILEIFVTCMWVVSHWLSLWLSAARGKTVEGILQIRKNDFFLITQSKVFFGRGARAQILFAQEHEIMAWYFPWRWWPLVDCGCTKLKTQGPLVGTLW